MCIGCAQNGRVTLVTDGGSWCGLCKPAKQSAYRHPDYVALKTKLRKAAFNRAPIMCAWCHVNPATEPDHIVPLAHGGKPDKTNLCPSCRSCNRGRNAGGHDG